VKVDGMTTEQAATDVQCGQLKTCDVPRWALRLLYRLAQLQRGHAYTLTVIVTGDEPVWTVQPLGKVENV